MFPSTRHLRVPPLLLITKETFVPVDHQPLSRGVLEPVSSDSGPGTGVAR